MIIVLQSTLKIVKNVILWAIRKILMMGINGAYVQIFRQNKFKILSILILHQVYNSLLVDNNMNNIGEQLSSAFK
jgi:hypothetical protein